MSDKPIDSAVMVAVDWIYRIYIGDDDYAKNFLGSEGKLLWNSRHDKIEGIKRAIIQTLGDDFMQISFKTTHIKIDKKRAKVLILASNPKKNKVIQAFGEIELPGIWVYMVFEKGLWFIDLPRQVEYLTTGQEQD